jgi:hypothetical protein
MKNGTINWFGEVKRKNNSKNNSVIFLGASNPQKNTKKSIPQNINFFGFGKTKKYKMTPSPLFKKESIKKKKFSKWGDADLDGSPNYFDCDPRKAFKDAKKIPKNARLITAHFSNISEVREEKALKEKEEKNAKNILKKTGRGIKSLGKAVYRQIVGTEVYSPLKEAEEKTEENIKERAAKREKLALKYSQTADEKWKDAMEESDLSKEKIEKQKEKISDVKKRTKKIVEMSKIPGLKGQEAVTRFSIEEAQAAGKPPKPKSLEKLARIERKKKMFGDIQQEGKFSRDILARVPGGQLGRVLSGAVVDKSGEYSKALKAKSQRVRKMTAQAAGLLFGPSLMQTRFDSEPRGRGRPPGPSGEYKIAGKPVYEEEFQQYAIKQNRLNTMLPSEAQTAPLNPEYVAYMKAKAVAEREGLGEGQTENPELARARQNQMMSEEGMPMEDEMPTEELQMPTTGTSMMQSGQQQELIRQKRAYTRALPDEIKMAQQQAQQMDNILNAPNFMRGELKATGGSLLTPIGPSILEAPNTFKGEMRNVTKPNIDEGLVRVGDRPQTNPTGNEYLSINLMTGKPMLQHRNTEKWISGESL